jgi:multidrug efflux pump subunit AcrA (membrane-fusion protein)
VARSREVTVGPRHGDVVEIREGLKAGERVVVDHVVGLEDGAAIAPAAEVKP